MTTTNTATVARSQMGTMMSKVPEVTLFFWIIKVLATTVGETAADFLSDTLNLGLTNTTYIMGACLAAVLVFQFRARKYVPGIYWLAVVLISIVGTLITDNLVDNELLALKVIARRLTGERPVVPPQRIRT